MNGQKNLRECVYLRKLEQRYLEEQKEMEEMNQTLHKKNRSNNKEAYTNRSKSIGRKVGFAAVFADITRRGALPGEASIHTAEMTAIKIAMREIQKREDMRWVIYTDSLSSMLAIENNRESHPILNQIYVTLAELHNQEKQIILCQSLRREMQLKTTKM